ncbi:MAG: hypothetical protein KQJ78_02235 [Deltaproteobacteria bacterium]|nr:hypothetical protein [Deltaproteobacteria bacterium]
MEQPVVLWYVAAATFLLCHEMDSAYWREWEMFRLPGGPGLFMALHLPLVALVLAGLLSLAAGGGFGRVMAWALAGAGVLAAGLHGGFLLAGRPEFRSPVSLGILAGGVLTALGLAGSLL